MTTPGALPKPLLTPTPSAAKPLLTPTPSAAKPLLTPTPSAARPLLTPTPTGSPTPAPRGTTVKGTLLIARMKYLRARGEEDVERVLRRLSAEDQAVLRGMILPSSWYPSDLLVRLEMTASALLSQGDRKKLFVDMGRFTADTNLGPNGVQRPYIKEGDPQYLLRNVPRMYSAQHSGGSRTAEQTGPKSAVVRTLAGEDTTIEDCLTAVGWLKRAIEISGGRIVSVEETRCRARGGDACEYVCRWA